MTESSYTKEKLRTRAKLQMTLASTALALSCGEFIVLKKESAK